MQNKAEIDHLHLLFRLFSLVICQSEEGRHTTNISIGFSLPHKKGDAHKIHIDTLTDPVYALEPYAIKGQRDIRNSNDNIFSGGGDQLLLNLQGDTTSGFTGSMNIGLDLTDIETAASDTAAGGPGGPGVGPPP